MSKERGIKVAKELADKAQKLCDAIKAPYALLELTKVTKVGKFDSQTHI